MNNQKIFTENHEEFKPDMPSQRIFLMCEQELTGSDLVAQVINRFYPLLNEKQKCYLNHLALIKSFEKGSVYLLEEEHHLFRKQTDIDKVEQELCDKEILSRDIYRVLAIFNGNFLISPPKKRIEFCSDFESAVLALSLEEKRIEYPEGDKTTATELPKDHFDPSD